MPEKGYYAFTVNCEEFEDWECHNHVEALVLALVKTEYWQYVKFIDTSRYGVGGDWDTNVVIYFNHLLYDPIATAMLQLIQELYSVYAVHALKVDVHG